MKALWTTKAAIIALPLMIVGGPAQALKAEVVEYGVTLSERRPSQVDRRAKTLSPIHEMMNLRYIRRTDRLEVRLCKSFGVSVRFSDGPIPAEVEVRVSHPRFTRPDGETSDVESFNGRVIDGMAHIGFTFDHEWEARPGEWAIGILVDGVELARQNFTITMPPGDLRSECGVVS